ncbi:MAG: hypothetical protein ROO73_00985 [Roseivirga sp.]
MPGSEGIKILLGTVERPETLEQCVEVALNTALGSISMGKVFKQGAALCSFSLKQALKQKLRELIQKKAGKAVKAAGKTINFGRIKVPSEVFHKQIKRNILKRAGNFSKVVGKNPDVKIIGGKIRLTGRGPFKGKSFNTDLDVTDFFGDFL